MTREEAIELLEDLDGAIEDNHGRDYDEAFRMAIEALSADGATEEGNFVRLADALEALYEVDCSFNDYEVWTDKIKEKAIKVSADRPHGKWIGQNDELKISDYRCSICGYYQDDKTNFCPNCGARMVTK